MNYDKKKICIVCKKDKLVIEFWWVSENLDGWLNKCKICQKVQDDQWKVEQVEYVKNYFIF